MMPTLFSFLSTPHSYMMRMAGEKLQKKLFFFCAGGENLSTGVVTFLTGNRSLNPLILAEIRSPGRRFFPKKWKKLREIFQLAAGIDSGG
jgi:hypothetical protein